MDNNFLYYAFALVALVVGLFTLKKVATCLLIRDTSFRRGPRCAR